MTTLLTRGTGAMSGAAYLESLRDGREVWLAGERVADVTTHPAFARVCQSLAAGYDQQLAPATRDVMTYALPDGRRVSYSYLLPTSREELLQRRRNAEMWATATFGMVGRFPDFCAALVVGLYDVREELAAIRPEFAANVVAYHRFAQEHDLSLSHALHDPTLDKSLRPEQDPDRCIRIVAERDDGIVVRGARPLTTFTPFSNEILVYPMAILNEREVEFAVWFAVPIATPGLKVLCRETYTRHRDTFDHPLSVRFDEQDATVIFDDVVVPWERVFLAYDPLRANALRLPLFKWAGYSSLTRLLVKLDLMIGTAHLMAATSGADKSPHVQEELGELIMYTEMCRSALRGAEFDAYTTPGGLTAPANVYHIRSFMAWASERFVDLVRHVGTSAQLGTPMAADFDVPELQPLVERYFHGRGVTARERVKLCKLAWELTGDSFAGRQVLYERLHHGDPVRNVGIVYQDYDKSRAVALVERLLALE
ncbi:MAG TPA: 4-hydroxyphenylacetate 3-hydroxylase N-terminal domain-containing protein [Chloroflexota bacterium]|nr:4-hydroxyphenylacetate 3-hydroxylase N-terminal domain-containing protein [Chloroflexota bacterium]